MKRLRITFVIILLIGGAWLIRKNIYAFIVTAHPLEKMENFVIRDLNGNKLESSEFAGKVLVLDFWSISCGPCIKSFPEFQNVVNRYKHDARVAFLAVNIDRADEMLEKIRTLLAENKFTFPVANDEDAQLSDELEIKYLPTLIIVDREGWIRVRHIGYNKSFEDYELFLDSQIRSLL